LVVVVKTWMVLEMEGFSIKCAWELATRVETTGGTPSVTGGIGSPGSVSVVVKVTELVVGLSLGLGAGQRK
jgi:hypothetical protein